MYNIGIECFIVTFSKFLWWSYNKHASFYYFLSAWLYELTGKYSTVYAVLGGSFVLGGVLFLLIPFMKEVRQHCKSKATNAASNGSEEWQRPDGETNVAFQ